LIDYALRKGEEAVAAAAEEAVLLACSVCSSGSAEALKIKTLLPCLIGLFSSAISSYYNSSTFFHYLISYHFFNSKFNSIHLYLLFNMFYGFVV
jgi:hypothetical protein